MTRRLIAILLLAALLATSSIAPGIALGNDPSPGDGSVVSTSGRVLPPLPQELDQQSVHAEMLGDQGAGTFEFLPGGDPAVVLGKDGAPQLVTGETGATGEPDGSVGTITAPLTAAGLPNGLRKEVFGFLPYWMLTDSALAEMSYSLVSTIAYFSVGLRADGYLTKGTSTGWTGWNSAAMTQVLDRAHANGVKVVLTVTHMAWNGDYTAMTNLLTNSTRRNRAVNEIVNAVRARGADGVNLDFEPVPTSLRSQYVQFVRQLKTGLSAAGAGDFLTVCVMAGSATWATGYDVPGLTAVGAADALFVMAYDYHWSGSSRAGGVAPIDSPYTIDVNGTMLDFLAETSGSKLIWGVPYYGRTWPTTSGQVNSTTRSGTSYAYYYTGSLSHAAQRGRRWDDVGKVPWYRWQDSSGWNQGYYDDVTSLGIKYDLVNARGLAGTGMWTLLMDQGRNELWRLLADKFVNDTQPPVGGISLLPPSVDGQAVKVSWRVVDHASGVDRYNVQVRVPGGAWSTWLSGTRATSAWWSGVVDTRYEFRVQAIDFKGNAQAWVKVPGKPTSVKAGAFATVQIPKLNVRSGPGTGFAAVAYATGGSSVYVLEGPVAGSGYEWYRVQYGYDEWPSADYPRVGWMAVGSDSEVYLAPSRAPTVTRLSPFVRDVSATPAISPNGDGVQDVASVSFRLRDAASSVTLEIVNGSGTVVRSIALGARAAGEHTVTWDGRVTSGAVAPDRQYLPRIVAISSAGTHVGPAPTVDVGLLARFGITVDTTRPRVTAASPAAGAATVSPTGQVVIDFSEPMQRVGAASVFVRVPGGTRLPARNVRQAGRTRLVIQPVDPLPAGTELIVKISKRARDDAGNRHAATSWRFTTAPGTSYDPHRRLIVEVGRHTAYRIGTDARVSAPKSGTFAARSGADVGHRARLTNLPGRWLYVQNGYFAGRWLRESALDHLRGESERARYSSSTRVHFLPGTHTGYRFDASGKVTATRRGTLAWKSGANINGRRIINGVPYLSVVNGMWAGYLVPESSAIYRPGRIDRIGFPAKPRIVFSAGKYTGYRYRSDGTVRSKVTATLPRASGANASAWAVINGVPHYLVYNGIWAGTWVPDTSSIRLET